MHEQKSVGRVIGKSEPLTGDAQILVWEHRECGERRSRRKKWCNVQAGRFSLSMAIRKYRSQHKRRKRGWGAIRVIKQTCAEATLAKKI